MKSVLHALFWLTLGALMGGGAVAAWNAFLKIPMLPPEAATAPVRVEDVASAAQVERLKALQLRIRELEERLAKKTPGSTLVVTNVVERSVAERERPPRPGRMFRNLEELKKKDPAKYAEVVKRMEDFRKRREERERTRSEFLAAIDTSGMSADAKTVHEQLQALSAKQEELMTAMRNENLSDEDRDSIRSELMENRHTLEDLYASERTTLLDETAKSLGYSGEDVETFTDQIQSIIDNTDPHGGGPGGPGGPPPPGR